MRYRFFEGRAKGRKWQILVFETQPGAVYRFQLSRLSYVPLPAQTIEEVTGEMAGLQQTSRVWPIQSTTDADPHDIFAQGPEPVTAKS